MTQTTGDLVTQILKAPLDRVAAEAMCQERNQLGTLDEIKKLPSNATVRDMLTVFQLPELGEDEKKRELSCYIKHIIWKSNFYKALRRIQNQ